MAPTFSVFGGLGCSPSIHSCGEVHIPFENRGISGDFGEFRGISGDFGEFRGERILGVLGILVRFWLTIKICGLLNLVKMRFFCTFGVLIFLAVEQ